MSYVKHKGRPVDMDLFLKIGPVEYEYYMTGIRYTGPYKMERYFTQAAIKLIGECEGTWIQHVSDDSVYLVDIDYNVIKYAFSGELIRAEQLVQMDTSPFLEPKCMYVIDSLDQNNIALDFTFCVCGKYLVIQSPIDIKAFIRVCKRLGCPVSVKKADGAYLVTDKRQAKRKERKNQDHSAN